MQIIMLLNLNYSCSHRIDPLYIKSLKIRYNIKSLNFAFSNFLMSYLCEKCDVGRPINDINLHTVRHENWFKKKVLKFEIDTHRWHC